MTETFLVLKDQFLGIIIFNFILTLQHGELREVMKKDASLKEDFISDLYWVRKTIKIFFACDLECVTKMNHMNLNHINANINIVIR